MNTKEEIKKQCPEFSDYIDYCFETLARQHESKKVIEVFNALTEARKTIKKLESNNTLNIGTVMENQTLNIYQSF